jgi:integrase/recombinase XerD
MLEFYLRSARGIARARASLVGSYLDGFAAALRELDYCRQVGRWRITYAVHLGLWAAAEALCTADVTPDGLLIRKTKFGKTRLVPLHPSAQDGLEQYLHYRRAMAGGDDHVFVSLHGTRLSYGGFRKAWLVVLGQAGLSPRSGGRWPRVHDIRHTFATRALESAPDRRDRIARHMLAVSTYLGHSCVADTYWYFQTTPTLMAQVADACQRHFEGERP